MGVTGLWPILQPCARPTPLPTLNRKRLAVDASIWIYQFLKAVRDKEGNALRNSHIVGFFRRICKLLFFGIKPVFVFDGGAPALKRQTILGRKQRREGRREDAARTAGKLFAIQLQKKGEEEVEKRLRERERANEGLRSLAEDDDVVTENQQLVYAAEMGMNAQQRTQSRKFKKTDAYHLPELDHGIEGMGQPNDPRIMSAAELEEYARQFHNGEDVNLYDFSKIDFNGEFFMSLPPVDRYNILNAARLRSRLRMGLSKEQLEEMFPDRMAFSRFQIERVRERNELTQRLMNLNGMNGDDGMMGIGTGRIAGERDREYVLVKNDGVEGGWALGVVSTDKSVGERNKPIDVDALYAEPQAKEREEESEEEFEDVPVEGLNRLPRIRDDRKEHLTYAEFQAREVADQRRHFYASRNAAPSTSAPSLGEQQDTLFVDQPAEGPSISTAHHFNEEDEDLTRAIALSLQKDQESDELDVEKHLDRAIALSLQKNHDNQSESDWDAEFEDVELPQYEQRAVQDPKPLTSSSGRMVAHIVNNRASAAVPKPRTASVSSDSEMDLQSALAKARKEKAPEKKQRAPAPTIPNSKNPFDGPLPFERINFGTSIFEKKQIQPEELRGDLTESDDEDLAGGFTETGKEEEEISRPLPPWLAGNGDIRSQVQKQQEKDKEVNTEDKNAALEQERMFRRKNAPIEIHSSDDDSDVEVVDAPLSVKATINNLGKLGQQDGPPPLASGTRLDMGPSVERKSTTSKEAEDKNPGKEEVGWSESDYGGVTTKPAEAVDIATSSRSKFPSLEFEDVQVQLVDGLPGAHNSTTGKSPSPTLEDVEIPKTTPVSLPRAHAASQLPIDDSFEQEQPGRIGENADFDDFSDPDDEELLAQLAIEAEEHARFASTLNNKSERENQKAYEDELKTLRSQQKKDRRDADEVSQIMVTECQALLRLFGLPYITAPMEAEAQCAELVHLGLVDGVVTDDSDIFLFGGTRVYKNMFNSNKFVECYLASDIEKELSLSRDPLISIAQLLGSDYAEGLPGVGPVTAVEILSEFPDPRTGLEEFKNWWSSIQAINASPISTEPSLFRKKFRRSQATKLFLPATFPSAAVTQAYLHPDVDSTPEPFQWGVPDLDRLRDFLMATIEWTPEHTDEVLVPVIRDMNRREVEGTQSNITRYFEGAIGAGAKNTPGGKEKKGSKRMKNAVDRLRAGKRDGGGVGPFSETVAEKATNWAKKQNKRTDNEAKQNGKAKGKKRNAAPATPIDDDSVSDADVESEEESGASRPAKKQRRKIQS